MSIVPPHNLQGTANKERFILRPPGSTSVLRHSRNLATPAYVAKAKRDAAIRGTAYLIIF